MFRLFSSSAASKISSIKLPLMGPQAQTFSSKVLKKIPFLKFSHSTSWKWEKIVTLALLPTIPVSFFLLDKTTDSILATLTAIHLHQ
jgi:hypothetical protein